MTNHRHPPSNVSHDVHVDHFECREALDAFRLEAIQLEALANAASDAVTRLTFPSDREHRRDFDRIYALVIKVADEATALVAYGDELIDRFGGASKEPSETSPESEG